jgi:HD-GYP domain-containing protein (c-di-GMP phosphodiesterase class II)/Flp pilus assembly protein TadD
VNTDTQVRVDELNVQALALLGVDAEQAQVLIHEAHALATQTGYQNGVADSLFNLGKYKNAIGDLEEAIAEALIAKEIYQNQNSTDKTIKTLIFLGELSRNNGKLDESGYFLDEAILLSKYANQEVLEADALNIKASLSNMLGYYIDAIEKSKIVLAIRKKYSDLRGQSNTLMNIGITLTELGNYSEGLEFLFQAYEITQKNLEDHNLESKCLINIANIYQDTKNYATSIEYYLKSLFISQENSDKYAEISCLNNLGESYYLIENFEKAAETFEEAWKKAKNFAMHYHETFILNGLGKTHKSLGDYSKAIHFQELSLDLANQSNDLPSKINALSGLGDVYFSLSDPNRAIQYFEQALSLSLEIKQPKTAFETHQKLADAYQQAGNLPKTIEHLRDYHKLEREVLDQETAQKTKNLSVQFDLERARHEAEVYRVQNETMERANDLLEEKVRERTQELEEARVEIVMRLAMAAEYRDDNTGQHTLRVGRNSALLGEALGLPSDQVELMRSAARLHDVGKIGITDLIMLKPGKLTKDEFERMKTHTTIGAQMLSNGQSPLLKMAETIALTHHERFDGTGYPKGLAGDDIPLVGRIVAVADVFDALRSDRPYKNAWDLEAARAEIQAQAGKHFDARVVDAFIKLLDAGVDLG